MSDTTQNLDLVTLASRTGQAVARLAQNDSIFRAAVDAFRAGDGDSFTRLLTEAKALEYCEEICRWFASKHCVLDCLELCGPPTVDLALEQVAEATAAIAKITQDEELVEVLADVVARRDAAGFKDFIGKQKLGPYCRFICSWVCTIRYSLICEVVCTAEEIPEIELADRLSFEGSVLGQLVANRDQLKQVIDAAIALNCEFLQGVAGRFNDCLVICRWICSWRSILYCGPICRPVVIPKNYIEEMRGFAQLCGRLADTQNAYAQFTAAIYARDQQAFGSLVKQFEIGEYCFQLCRWLSFEVCHRFCICICPQPETIPLFTKVGQYHVAPSFGNFQPDGTTTVGRYAFTSTVNLNGILPDGTAPDALEYRFTYVNLGLGGTPTAITGTMIPASSIIGQLEYYYWDTTFSLWLVGSTDFYVNNPSAAVDIPQQFGSPRHVVVDTDPDADGWIKVPRLNELFPGGRGRFVPTGLLAQLDTTQLTNEFSDLTAAGPGLPVVAGAPVPAAQQSLKPTFTINFEARNATTLAPVGSNSLAVIAFSNTEYKYSRHPDWAGSTPTSVPVVSLDILELQSAACQPVDSKVDTLHILFTAYHPYAGSVSVQFVGPSPLPADTVPAIPADGDVFSGAAGVAVDISMLTPCAYVVFLNVNLRLTNGDVTLSGTYQDFVAFCRD